MFLFPPGDHRARTDLGLLLLAHHYRFRSGCQLFQSTIIDKR